MFTSKHEFILRVSIMLLFTDLVYAEESVKKRLPGVEAKMDKLNDISTQVAEKRGKIN